MAWALLVYIVVLVLGGSAMLLLATQIGRRVPGAAAFTVFLLAVALWTFAYAAELGSQRLVDKIVFASLLYVGVSVVPIAWLQFVWAYTGHPPLAKNRWFILAAIPTATILLVWTNSWHGLIWSQVSLGQAGTLSFFDKRYGAWFWVHTIYSYSLLAAGFVVLFRTLWHRPALYRGQARNLLLAALAPWVGNLLFITKQTPVLGLDLTPFGFIIMGLVLAWSLIHVRLLDLAPLAQRLVFETINDGLIVLDAQQRIVDMNDAAQRFLQHPTSGLLGQPAAAALADFGAAELWHPQAAVQRLEVEITVPGVPVYVEIQSLPLGTATQPSQGRLILLRDCTPYHSVTAALKASVAQANHNAEAAQRHARELALLDQVRLAVARELDLPVVLHTVVEAVAATFGYTQVSLYLLQDDVLVLQHQVGYASVITRIPITEGVAGRVVRTGIPVLLEDVHADPNFLGAINGIVSEVCVPLIDQGHVVGMLNVESTNGVTLTADDLRIMQTLGDHITIAMARARLYDETQRAAQQLRAIITNVPMILSVVGADGRIIMSEGKGLAALGLQSSEFVGQSAHAQFGTHPDYKLIEQALAGEDVHHAMEMNGRTLNVYFTPMRTPDGQITGVLSVALDITEQQRAEDERRMLERSFFEAQKLESLGMLAGGIAHDFNNLLQAIIGNASLSLLELPPDSPARTNIARIDLAAQHAADLTRQILAYAGKGSFVAQPLDLSSIVAEMLLLLEVSIPKHITLQTTFAPALPCVSADGAQMRQIVMNLISNAAEAIGTADGVISLTTGTRQLDSAMLSDAALVSDLPAGPYVYLQVTDTGCGMDAATQARIFEPFFTTKFTGRGLGLAAVFGIVRAHQGALQVRSVPEQGTTFTVFLPADTAAAAFERYIDRILESGETAVPPEQKTALVIDDEAAVRSVIARMLEQFGFTVLAASDGHTGVEQFRAQADRIDVVLVDLTMPHMNGAQTLAAIRAIRPDTPAFLMSGYTAETVIDQLGDAAVAGFLQKPFTLAEVRATIAAAQHGWSTAALAE